MSKDTFRKEINEVLVVYQQLIVNFTRRGLDGRELESSSQWSFAGAFLYSLTVITTIGKSN